MKYFTVEELCKSDTAISHKIDNSPNGVVKINIERLIDNVLDKLREAYGKPIKVNSGYRCPKLNALVKGSKTSDHMVGCAADITGGNITENRKLFDLAISLNLPFDQCIDERNYKWVHISYNPQKNRKMILHIK